MATPLDKRMAGVVSIWYRIRADLCGRRLAAGSVVFVIALATLLVDLGLLVSASATTPFDHLFQQLNGAHLWIYPANPLTQAQQDAITHFPNVAGSTGVEVEGQGNMLLNKTTFVAHLQSFPVLQPAIGRLSITQGRGLSTGDPDGIIIDQPFADAHQLQIGNRLSIATANGLVTMHIRGVAIDVNHSSLWNGRECVAHLLQTTLIHLFPAQRLHTLIGLRLNNPAIFRSTLHSMIQRLQAQGYQDAQANIDWQDWLAYQADFAQVSQVTIALLLAFGIVSLVASGVIVANLVIGQVLAQRRDIGVLKAIGFTPGQLVLTLVLEYVMLGCLGGLMGLGLVALIAPPFLVQLSASLYVPISPQYDPGSSALLLLVILLGIALCALVPGLKAGRTSVMNAIRPDVVAPERGLARLTGLLLMTKLPLVTTLGIRGITARPLRSLLVALTLLLSVITSVFGLSGIATLNNYTHNPALLGIFADTYVQPNLYSPEATQQLMAADSEIASYYTSYSQGARFTKGTGQVEIIFTSGNTQRIASTISTGRWYQERGNELVLGDQAMQRLNVRIGDQLPVVFTLQQGQHQQVVHMTYTVVGSLYATQGTVQGYAPLSGLTARVAISQDTLLANTGYEVTLHAGVSTQTFSQRMIALTADRIGVKIYDTAPEPGVIQGLNVMTFLSIALMVIAGVSMLNAMMLSIRERYRELGTLKAIGVTPWQLLRSVTEGAIGLGWFTLIVGIPLGIFVSDIGLGALIDSLGGVPHFQLGINWLALVLLVPVTLFVAALGALLPAYQAARISVAEALRYE